MSFTIGMGGHHRALRIRYGLFTVTWNVTTTTQFEAVWHGPPFDPSSSFHHLSIVQGLAEAGMLNIDSPTSGETGISRIPLETLCEIFICCLPVHFASQSQNIQETLGSVCRRWRALALATPALWSSLIITYGIDTLHPPLPVIRTYLQRSGTHPLSFVLHAIDQKYFHSDSPHLLSALTTLVTVRQRWGNVKIGLFWMVPDALDLITQGDAPLLRSIQCDIFGFLQRFPVPLNMLSRYPHLESLRWNSPGSPILLPLVNTQLTSLSLRTSLSVSDCVTLLRLSPRLSSAVFDILNSPGASTIPRLTHPTLCTLAVAGEYPNVLLHALTLPALLDLNLTTEHTSIPLPPEWDVALPAFLERSRPRLHKLSLYMGKVPQKPTIMRILTLTPHLRNLTLAQTLLTATFIYALHPKSQLDPPLCPHLRILVLSQILDCPDGLCTAMLRARWGGQAHANGVACLEAAYIRFKGGIHDRDRADMRELCAEGMKGAITLGG